MLSRRCSASSSGGFDGPYDDGVPMQTVIDELPLLLQGVVVTLQISVLVIVAGSLIGMFTGLGLLYGPAWLRPILRGYVDLMRGLPLLVTIFIIFYVPPSLGVEING